MTETKIKKVEVIGGELLFGTDSEGNYKEIQDVKLRYRYPTIMEEQLAKAILKKPISIRLATLRMQGELALRRGLTQKEARLLGMRVSNSLPKSQKKRNKPDFKQDTY